jgi:hypothetical protein
MSNFDCLGGRTSDVHHGNYNPSCKAKTNVQEDSDGPMTRARAKQLQRALTSQIEMIEDEKSP